MRTPALFSAILATSLGWQSATAVIRPAPSLLRQLPLRFIENRGQLDARVAYYARGADKTAYFTSDGVSFVLHRPASGTLLADAGPVDPIALQRWALQLEF